MPGREQLVLDIVAIPNPAIVAEGYFMTAERLENMLDPMFESVEIFADQIRQNFETESAGGSKWAAWAPVTAAKRGVGKEEIFETKLKSGQVGLGVRAKDPGKILQESGALYTGAVDSANWDIVQEGRAATAVLEDPTGYGKFHLTGRGGTNFMPVRDWAFLPDDVWEKVEEKFFDYLAEDL